MTYVNSNNQSVEFGVNGLYMNEVALGWKFEAKSNNGVIVSFSSGLYNFSLPAVIIADSDEQANMIRDRLHDICLFDVISQKKGKLIYRGYTLDCNINEIVNSSYRDWTAFGDVKLNVITDKPIWRKSKTVSFRFISDNQVIDNALDYDFDYPFDYGLLSQNKMIFENESFVESDFILKIQGEVNIPAVYINDHLYSVDTMLSYGDILEINSKEHKIVLTKSNGKTENCFDLRNRDSYIFQKIAAGINTIRTSQKLNVQLTCFDERGEPKWT